MNAARHLPILIADIGGTHARFALADTTARSPLMADSIRRYRVAAFPSLEAAATRYLRETGAKPRRAAFAVAGHIDDGKVHATNSPWRIVARELRHALGLGAVRLLNDFAAQSMCLPLLHAKDTHAVGSPVPPDVGSHDPQTFAVVGPGTGLGVGALLLRGGCFLPLETEGGHCDYAPGTAEEIELLKVLSARFGHVSCERLISGIGLVNLRQALATIDGTPVEPMEPEQVTRRAQQGDDTLCVRTVEQFCSIFGAIAGNAALTLGGWDGVFLAGALPPVLLPWLEKGAFRKRFEEKGRFAATMRSVPTVVITHTDAGLLGAAASAVAEAGGSLLRPAVTRVAVS